MFDKSICRPDLARGPQFGGPAIEVNDDDHYLFMGLRIGYCYVYCVEKNAWIHFQITRGQWGTFVQPGSISCCFLWVRYRAKTRLTYTAATAADIQWRKMQWRIYAKWANSEVKACALSNNLCRLLYVGTIFSKPLNVLKRKIFVFIFALTFLANKI